MRQEIRSLTGLRFIAAASILVSHALPTLVPLPQEQNWRFYVTQSSGLGMSLFFVLSGFVIHFNYSDQLRLDGVRGVANFLIARFARIYPLYILCFCYELIRYWSLSGPGTLLYYLVMGQSWFYILIGGKELANQYGPIGAISWSISTEWFFYLVYPFILLGLSRLSRVRSIAIASVVVGIVGYLGLVVTFANINNVNDFAVRHFGKDADFYSNTVESFFRWLMYFSPYVRLPEFVAGCLAASALLNLRGQPVTAKENRLAGISLFGSVAIILVIYLELNNRKTFAADTVFHRIGFVHASFTYAPLLAVTIFCLGRYRSTLGGILSTAAIVGGGNISYSIYMLHPKVIEVFVRIAAVWPNWPSLLFAFAVVSTFGVSWLAYRIWEKPARNCLKAMFSLPR